MSADVNDIRSGMEIIPVIDLMGGAVVHARQGQREAYRAIVSPLCATSAPNDVLAGLFRLHSFQKVYIADLDAIENRGEHSKTIAELARAHSSTEFWVDSGNAYIQGDNVNHILGSESIRATERLQPVAPSAILSLDFRGGDFIGPPELFEQSALWPEHVIVMTLARVGSGAGPDLERLASIKQRAGARRVYAAGGVRHRADLEALHDAGIAGVLVASALHDGRLTSADLADFS
jgi:phosphoribosylformimino-5-aminoimidazole carboxamide ribotide isomerase